MNDIAVHADHLLDLAEAVCNRDASKADLVKLKSLLLGDPTACRRYLLYCEMQAALRFEVRADRAAQKVCQQIDIKSVPHAPPESDIPEIGASVNSYSTFLSTTLHGTIGYFSHEIPFSFLIGAVLTSLLVLVAWLVPVSRQMEIVKDTLPTPLVNQRQFIPDSKTEIVGKITGMVDAKWADPNTETFHGANVLLGRKYALSSGLIEITYDTGAKVILQGPMTYEVESKNGGYMSVGKITGKVKNETAKGFAIRTPTAIVTDLGTEFGVEVDKNGLTTSHVFRGRVEFRAIAADKKPMANAKILHAHESARIEQNRENQLTVIVAAAATPQFVRILPSVETKRLDLVDVVAGGNGFSKKNGAGIDPTTGQATTVPLPDPKGDSEFLFSDNKYHRVTSFPVVDGVFIPNGNLQPNQVDSAGRLFDGFVALAGRTSGHIWAGGVQPPEGSAAPRTKLGNIDYASPDHQVLRLHANKGITFNLDAIRLANPKWKITCFTSMAGNAETASALGANVSADLWVLVDGKRRVYLREINGCGGALPICIPITKNDHYLTLAATDGGNGIEYDWIMFGDPCLELVSCVTSE